MARAATGTAGSSELAKGVWAPAITPVDTDLKPDPARYVQHVKWLLDRGCHGVGLFGTTGEATSFSLDERETLLEAVLEAGVPADSLMVGTGCCALSDSVRLTAGAASRGVNKVLMLPPFYYKGIGDEGLFASYSEVIQRVGSSGLQLYFYHFPRLSGVPVPLTLVESLLKAYPATVAGLKDSSGDWESTKAYIAAFPDMAIFPGKETLLLDGLRAGGAGTITASANANPAAIRRVYDAWEAGLPDVDALQQAITSVRGILDGHPMIPALKRILSELHGDEAWRGVRPPLSRLDEQVVPALLSRLAAAGFSRGTVRAA